MFWLRYECFSIVCNAFLLKSTISSHNSCVRFHLQCARCNIIIHIIMCFICFLEHCLDIFLKILKDKGMHQCDLVSQEELNIENNLPLFMRV